ncbi:baseplate J/gp47 family protein [Selenomonadales bacterium OttesenSCG-928-I06]|nr:baseplate J/gp47 family protein [Selenomonadales bacterium OttesenSCG-928-I06]
MAELIDQIRDFFKETDVNGEIQFVEIDTEKTLLLMVNLYEAITKRTLGRADPVMLFLEAITYMIVLLRAGINYTGKMNLLRYAKGKFLDELGYLVGTPRLDSTAALTTILITLSDTFSSATTIPKNTRVTPDNNIFFAIEEDVIIPAGETTAQVVAVCTEKGIIGNDFAVGAINQIVDPHPYVLSMVNVTSSQGGSDVEEDDPYRLRVHEAAEHFSVAGPDGAYRYYAMSANPLIVDVQPVMYPNPGDVTLFVLLQNGELPGPDILQEVLDACNADDIRPLTDHVFASAPSTVNYDLDVTYFIHSENQARVLEIQKTVNQAVNEFILWNKARIGRDINPSELIKRMVSAGAKRVVVNSPIFQELQAQEIAIESNVNIVFGGVEDD